MWTKLLGGSRQFALYYLHLPRQMRVEHLASSHFFAQRSQQDCAHNSTPEVGGSKGVALMLPQRLRKARAVCLHRERDKESGERERERNRGEMGPVIASKGAFKWFQWQKPRLSDMVLDDVQCGGLFQRLTFVDTFLKILDRGQDGAVVLQRLCCELAAVLTKTLAEQPLPPIPTLACEEVHQTCEALGVLCGSKNEKAGELLDALATSKVLNVIKQQIIQIPFWRKQEKMAREGVAQKAYLPEIQSLETKAAAGELGLSDLQRIAARIVLFEDGLGAGAVRCICH